MSTTRRVIQNSALNFAAGVSQRIGQTIVFILIARLLTQEVAGAYKLANTYTSVLLTFSLWGLDHLLIREVAKQRDSAATYLGGFLGLRLVLATGLWLILALIMPLLPYSEQSKTLILFMTFTIVPGSINNLYQAIWMAFENIKAISAVIIFFSMVRVVGGALLLYFEQPVVSIAYLFIIASLGEMGANVVFTHYLHRVSGLRIPFVPKFWLDNFRIAFPLIVVSLVLIVEYQFDVVILSFFWPEEEVGIYGTAATILTLLLFLTRSYQLAIFPILSRAFHEDRERLKWVYARSIVFLALGALAVIGLMSVAAEFLITAVFGPMYQPAADMLRILVWVFLFSAINVPNSRLMIVADKQRVMAWFAFFSMSASLLFSLWLVPRYGGIGTAWARVLAMPVYTISSVIYVQRHICPITWRLLWKVALPGRVTL